ncbi:MAG: LysM peptidoglycan-binding domain-containing protein [Christensenellales bacterium]
MKRFVIRINEQITLEEVCKKYKMNIQRLININNLHTHECYVGMRLIIEQTEGVDYVVKPFDTLDKIATNFGVDKAVIMEFNNVGTVFLGQKIFIPTE